MYGNPYFAQQQTRFQQPIINQPTQPQPYIPSMQPISNPTSLLGKAVESIDVVRAMDIPFDGSISYFPLTDGSAIITKQLQNDGTSRTVVYKPVEDNKKETIKFATLDDIQNAINELDIRTGSLVDLTKTKSIKIEE